MPRQGEPQLFLGLISGTSVDSIDAALVDLAGGQARLVHAVNMPWPGAVRDRIFFSRILADTQLHSLNDLDIEVAECFAEVTRKCLKEADVSAESVTAIGSHGQTIRHRPDGDAPFSLQLGNAERIAELTGIDVISDFRKADILAGGEGAPLVPAFHEAVFRDPAIDRVIINIGGISNITVLPSDSSHDVLGFDTGPGNNLMDAWCQRHRDLPYDDQGRFAASGKTDVKLLARCLMDDYFDIAPPKSTGFEYFNLQWLQGHMIEELLPEDVQSTLCDLTVTANIRDINRYAADTREIYVCGGGAQNDEILRRLQEKTMAKVSTTEALGVHPDWVEAMTFAWLAYRHVNELPGNLPSVTGADKPVVLGSFSPVSEPAT